MSGLAALEEGRLGTGAVLTAVLAAAACSIAPTPTPALDPTRPDPTAQGEFETLWSHYERQVSPKAFAFAYDGNEWAWGIAEQAGDRGAAREEALGLCELARTAQGVRAACTVYAVDGEVVWSLADHLAEFQSYPVHKAFWVAGPRSRPIFDAVIGAESAEAAAMQAMRDCEAEVGPYGLTHTCRICQVDDGVPCTRLESGWPAD
jgi:hypothetical protein